MPSLKLIVLGAAMVAVPAGGLAAKDNDRKVGNWLVTHMIDNMDDSTKDIALVPDADERYALILRCFDKEPEAFIFVGKDGNKFDDKDGYKVMFRVDQTKPVDMAGTAQSNGSLALSQPTNVIRGALGASKIAFRFEGANESFTSDVVFQTTRNRDALADIVKTCSISPNG